jgi:guanosine-3',5'-bis(diphosphate) 3'-pyrophosphohydrolase
VEEKIDKGVLALYDQFKKEINADNIDLDKIDKAFLYAYEKHKGQKRASGENYIIHPINVARIVNNFYLDEDSLITALLHDILEDTDTKSEEIEEEFGKNVLFLVESLTKIGKIEYKSKEETQADNFRKMVVAMAKDIRVILIKLADRLHNMRTICFLNNEKQSRIAKETMDVYAPIAHRLGIYWLKSELEDISFKYLHPKEYENLENKIKESLEKKQEIISYIEMSIKRDMKEAGIDCEVNGRVKHLYSIYTKMQRKNMEFDGIYDLLAVRIITKTEADCYAALGVIHKNYKPLPGRFKDYIALPKQNLYQSLHTTIFGPSDAVVEIQIRTKQMHEVAEEGIAAHYRYKEGLRVLDKHEKQFLWLRRLLKWQNEVKDPKEFLNTVRVDLFRGEVYVFTPAGDLKVLPRGATCIDFAYAIHTEVGNHCVGARVNGKMVPLKTELINGDIVEIQTQTNHEPSRDWLKFVVTSKARSKIKQKVRDRERKEASEIGKNLLSKELYKINKGLQEFLKEQNVEEELGYFGCNTTDELFEKIGFLKIHPMSVVNKFYPDNKKKQTKTSAKKEVYKIRADGIDNIVVRLAKCCSPVFGEDIVGYVTKNRGIVIHRRDCENIQSLGYDCERLVDVEWDDGKHAKLPVDIKITAVNKIGVLAYITNTATELYLNVKDIKIRYLDDKEERAFISLKVEIEDKKEVDKFIALLNKNENILDIKRGKKSK